MIIIMILVIVMIMVMVRFINLYGVTLYGLKDGNSHLHLRCMHSFYDMANLLVLNRAHVNAINV